MAPVGILELDDRRIGAAVARVVLRQLDHAALGTNGPGEKRVGAAVQVQSEKQETGSCEHEHGPGETVRTLLALVGQLQACGISPGDFVSRLGGNHMSPKGLLLESPPGAQRNRLFAPHAMELVSEEGGDRGGGGNREQACTKGREE